MLYCKRKSHAVFIDRMEHSSAIMINHSVAQLRSFCNAGIVLESGRVESFENLEEAIAVHEAIMS